MGKVKNVKVVIVAVIALVLTIIFFGGNKDKSGSESKPWLKYCSEQAVNEATEYMETLTIDKSPDSQKKALVITGWTHNIFGQEESSIIPSNAFKFLPDTPENKKLLTDLEHCLGTSFAFSVKNLDAHLDFCFPKEKDQLARALKLTLNAWLIANLYKAEVTPKPSKLTPEFIQSNPNVADLKKEFPQSANVFDEILDRCFAINALSLKIFSIQDQIWKPYCTDATVDVAAADSITGFSKSELKGFIAETNKKIGELETVPENLKQAFENLNKVVNSTLAFVVKEQKAFTAVLGKYSTSYFKNPVSLLEKKKNEMPNYASTIDELIGRAKAIKILQYKVKALTPKK